MLPVLAQLLLVWFTANYLPHIIIILAAGKPYFAMPLVQGTVLEMAIMGLNLALPLIAIVVFSKVRPSSFNGAASLIKSSLAWRWEGWKTLGWGLLAFVFGFILVFPVVNTIVGAYPFPYNSESTGPINLATQWYLVVLILALWVVTVLGEEVMFRGYIQTGLERRYGALVGIIGTALLFSLRHTPADLYWGWNAPLIQWASRLGQLILLALVLSLVRYRSRSMIPTVIAHGLGWIYVIMGAPIG
jgi:membrane protease YdiL (CAAX protease family)